jgi:Na+/H+-dicarboxylate symporter
MDKTRLALHWKILIGLALGLVAGVLVNVLWTEAVWTAQGVHDSKAFLAASKSDANNEATALAYLARFAAQATQFLGDLFIRCLRFIAVPIVLFSLTVGVASLGDVRKLGRIGGKTLAFFAATTLVAACIGLACSNVVKPGTFVPEAKRQELASGQQAAAQARISAGEKIKAETSIWKQVLDIVPANPFAALAQADMLQVVVLSVALGLGVTLIPREKSSAVVRMFDGLQESITALVRVLMHAAPVAVFALIAGTVAKLGWQVMGALGVYCVVTIVALAIVQLVMYPAFLYVLTRRDSRMTFGRFMGGMSPAMLLAFSSSSSSATLPVTMQCVRDRLGVSEEIASFVCPLGATVNMAGTALYQAVAATFIAQLYGIHLELSQQATIVALATLIAIGSPGVPGGSIVMMVIVLESVGIPPGGIAVILAVDRVLDMCRTIVNVSGDAAAAVVVASSEGQLATKSVDP